MQPLVLINRFMINIRTVDSEVSDYSVCLTDRQQAQPSVQFRRSTNRLGNTMGTLYDGLSNEPWDGEASSAEIDEAGCWEAIGAET
ncbi:uncharacterized protein PHACADRAFT_251365 [Phanerochaete carnosa HHB-10118-sp]|uniref:Uncharacterized protein n=1 Tax=Phanerochaete carnosa (strain HHB-10118-sp) TaxID=650164 RepID=K5W1A3_PHACS|nr:uncharacterized protein PHACADRAFT_251365 [Phanerochaete carnosa HHB-10118-sp]EKM57633.1 hypothetical protein PHACADRAFT_251365 [Phanerochaete carnosa HHB-10118-sp]